MQKEIIFVKKLIKIRLAAERLNANKKPNVASVAEWLKIHIEANKYDERVEARWFFIRHNEKIEYLIPSGKPRLREEFERLNNLK